MKIEGKLLGEKTALRSYRKSDLDFVSGIWFDGENGKYLSDPEKEFIDEKFQRAIDGLEDSPLGFYFVAELEETGVPVGTCCAFPDDGGTAYDIGYCVHKSYWRQGLGMDMVTTLIKWIRSVGGKRVTAEAARENSASCELLKKLGFEVVKESSFKKYNMNVAYDSFIFGKTL